MPRFAGTMLPHRQPVDDDHLVTVCASCERACCYLERFRCDARKNGATDTTERRMGWLRAAAKEHHSYWYAKPGDDPDMPKSIEDLQELAAHQRQDKSLIDKRYLPPDPDMFAGYIIHELGLDATQCRDVLKDVWPEASKSIDDNILAEAG